MIIATRLLALSVAILLPLAQAASAVDEPIPNLVGTLSGDNNTISTKKGLITEATAGCAGRQKQ